MYIGFQKEIFFQVAEKDHLQAGSWMAKMPSPIPGLGKFLSESTVATSVEDHLLTETGLSLRLIALKIIPIQVATPSLWVSLISK